MPMMQNSGCQLQVGSTLLTAVWCEICGEDCARQAPANGASSILVGEAASRRWNKSAFPGIPDANFALVIRRSGTLGVTSVPQNF
jgi:hypothetical protein